MFEQPMLARRLADTVMDAGIVPHDHRWQTVAGGEHTVKKRSTSGALIVPVCALWITVFPPKSSAPITLRRQ
ncbi:hypothetical protein [Paraburkholderia humisilvae]|uniref:Uncharacterized protein n=1 Tax=Paraburkholderia humisilvae TaxID=627669 RepID=A0A6J5F727_9BURK|nr:hypothetical protein [Paraburkholderia humisilvae]CAB3774708.1 hypothetical protein LMG29542_08086 [Paraburkholderia humisilvae]